jgi:hypothetical protein
MQLDPDLTLDKAISLARQSEAVKKQQPLIRGQIEPVTKINSNVIPFREEISIKLLLSNIKFLLIIV